MLRIVAFGEAERRAPIRDHRTSVFATLFALCLLTLTFGSSWAASAFTNVDESSIPQVGIRLNAPEQFSAFHGDLADLLLQLENAPVARTNSSLTPPTIQLPMPDGSVASFQVYNSPVMAPELAAQYPELQTFEAYGLDDPSAFSRFSVTPKGFHAVIFTSKGSIWIDPYQTNDVEHVVSCEARHYRRNEGSTVPTFSCDFEDDPVMSAEIADLVENRAGGTSTGDELRTYRLACAATGEYTSFHGGSVGDGMDAIVTAMNRINGVYQKDLSIFMELIGNNNLIVYTNGGSDPYNNSNGSQMLGQNQSNLDSVIGTANYDIGHVFSTGGGGIAGLGVVCRAGNKARGVTGLGSPIGDRFYIDYVAHEMGHQYGANHTFNGTIGSCCCGNRSGGHAYEPGSGSTIMAYAGICGGHNIQNASDDYFHNDSFNAIRSYTENGSGNGCPVTTATGNTPPSVDADIGGNFYIPVSTYFEITGSAVDADDDPLTYCWEQFDLGPGGHPNSPSGNAPLFRSWDPVETPTRIFPRIEEVVSGNQRIGEILPSYTRGMRFRLTVRDGLGGTDYATVDLDVTDTAGPFEVTNPNTSGTTWASNTARTVQWDVAGSNTGLVDCQSVDILLSVDGGFTYPYTLLTSTPNDGSASVTVPAVTTTAARVKVAAADNVFFDISDEDFDIEDSTDIDDRELAEVRTGFVQQVPNPFRNVNHVSFRIEQDMPVSLKVYTTAGREIATLAEGNLTAGEHSRSWNGTDYNSHDMPAGVYLYKLQMGDKTETSQVILMK